MAFLLIGGLGILTGCGDRPSTSIAVSEGGASEAADPGLLRSIMVDLGADMNEISRGLWQDDLPAVAVAAKAIAEHPHVSDTERARIQRLLGASFADFVQGDRRVHDAALRLSGAAAAGELAGTLDQLAELQAGCVACHQEFRERLR